MKSGIAEDTAGLRGGNIFFVMPISFQVSPRVDVCVPITESRRPGRDAAMMRPAFILPSARLLSRSLRYRLATGNDVTAQPIQLLESWLERQLDAGASGWLREQLGRIAKGSGTTDLHKTLGLAPRRLGKADLALTPADLQAADAARAGWDPTGWTVDEAARIVALLRFAESAADFPKAFTAICRTADVGEAVALYRGLPLYAEPERLDWQVGEGLRTSMRAVFEAIAHKSPYPREHFSQERWNHMVLKALFIGSTLHPIQGLDERANAELAAILSDYAHERWAAGRPVTPELWRCLGPFAAGGMMDDLRRLAASTERLERQAAALALSASRDDAAPRLLDGMPDLADDLKAGRLTWATVSAVA